MLSGMHLTPIGGGQILLEPGEGLDPSDPEAYLLGLAEYLQAHAARRLIYDLNTVPLVDKLYYGWLQRLARLCRVSGVDMVVVNMRPEAAFALAMILEGAPPFVCALDVDRARAL